MVRKKKNLKNTEVKVDNMKRLRSLTCHYWKPTPKKWRKIGDGLLAAASVIAIGGIWQFETLKDIFTPTELKGLIIASIGLGVVGKFLTNFFKEDTPKKD